MNRDIEDHCKDNKIFWRKVRQLTGAHKNPAAFTTGFVQALFKGLSHGGVAP